ncbi:Hypothetical predicted protein, partial [Olea europaea subsp. europaea]
YYCKLHHQRRQGTRVFLYGEVDAASSVLENRTDDIRAGGNLEAVGVMMGNDQKTDRKSQNTLTALHFFLVEGWTRDNACAGDGRGGGAVSDIDDSSPLMGLKSAIIWLLDQEIGEIWPREWIDINHIIPL